MTASMFNADVQCPMLPQQHQPMPMFEIGAMHTEWVRNVSGSALCWAIWIWMS